MAPVNGFVVRTVKRWSKLGMKCCSSHRIVSKYMRIRCCDLVCILLEYVISYLYSCLVFILIPLTEEPHYLQPNRFPVIALLKQYTLGLTMGGS